MKLRSGAILSHAISIALAIVASSTLLNSARADDAPTSSTRKLVWRTPSQAPAPNATVAAARTTSGAGVSAVPTGAKSVQYLDFPERKSPETTDAALKIIPATNANHHAEALPAPLNAESVSVGRGEPNYLGSDMPMKDEQMGAAPASDFDSCQDTQGKCRANWEKLKGKSINDIQVDLAPHSLQSRGAAIQGRDYPCECALPRDRFLPREWACNTYQWQASALCYKPLYFEEQSLERYGHTCHPYLQPFCSCAHFFAACAVLPYSMGIETPCECIYPLGTYRPGDCCPRICDGVPLSIRGSLLEAGAVSGLVFLIP